MRLFLQKLRPTLIIFVVLAIVGYAAYALAGDTVTSGWSWSSNIGWIHGNNCVDPSNPNCTPEYGVTVLSKNPGTLSGWVWSANIGWIGFDSDATVGCPSGACKAWVDWSGSGPYPVKGWARACSVFANGCSGDLKSDAYLGGWDGFISLSGSKSGVSWGPQISADGKWLTGFVWGSQVIGWINTNFKLSEPATDECTGSLCPAIDFSLYDCVDPQSKKPVFEWESENTDSCSLTDGITTENNLDTSAVYPPDYKTNIIAAPLSKTYTLQCTGNFGKAKQSLTVSEYCAQGFTVRANPTTKAFTTDTVDATKDVVTFTISVSKIGSYKKDVALSFTQPGSNPNKKLDVAAFSFSPTTLTSPYAGTATLTVRTPKTSIPAGVSSFPVTVTGTGTDGVTSSTSIIITPDNSINPIYIEH